MSDDKINNELKPGPLYELTPGPWEVAQQQGTVEGESIRGVLGPAKTTKAGLACRFYVCQYVRPVDAIAIAALPDLIEALQQCLQHVEYDEHRHGRKLAAGNLARYALKKAKG